MRVLGLYLGEQSSISRALPGFARQGQSAAHVSAGRGGQVLAVHLRRNDVGRTAVKFDMSDDKEYGGCEDGRRRCWSDVVAKLLAKVLGLGMTTRRPSESASLSPYYHLHDYHLTSSTVE